MFSIFHKIHQFSYSSSSPTRWGYGDENTSLTRAIIVFTFLENERKKEKLANLTRMEAQRELARVMIQFFFSRKMIILFKGSRVNWRL